MYAGTPKHPIFSGSTFGLMSGEKPLFQPQVQGGHEALGSVLNQMGLRYEETSGRYNEPERSYIIHNPTLDQMKQLGKMFGQESVIHSVNGQHQFHYTNGENEGKYHVAEHQNPIEHFEQPPPDAYTKLPGHGYFRINFNWGQTHGGELAKAWPQPIKPEDQGGVKAGSNSGPQDYLTHATAPGQNRSQTQINPVVHDELIGSMSGGNEAGGVVDSAGVKTVEHRPNPDQVHLSSQQQIGIAQQTADTWAANDAQNALIPHRQETWADSTDTLGGDFQTEVNHHLAPFDQQVSLGGVNWAFEHRPYTKFGGAVVAATGASRDGRSFHLFHVDPSGQITGYDPRSDTVGHPIDPTAAPLVQHLQNHFAGKLDYFKSETEELFERLIKAKLSKAKPPQIPYETQVAMDGLQEQGFGLGDVPQSAGPVGIVSERAARANKMTPAGGYANLNSPAVTEAGPTQHAEALAAKFGIQNPDAARSIFWDDAVNAHVSRDPDDPNYRQYAHYPTMPGVMAADDLGPELERHHFNDQSNPNEPPASALSMVPPKEVMDLAWKASPAHPHSYDWHDGHTDHHEQDLGGPRLPGNLNDITKADNDQAAGVGVSTYKQFALPYGQVTPGQNTNLLHYPYHGKLAEIEKLVANHGYKTYYAGGKYGKPDLANKNYNTGHLMVYDPTPASGGDFGEEEYTKGWRQIHELAHALTYPELNKIYGEGRRIGKLGHHRTMNEALRAVHWEWLAGHKQRELSEQIGIKIPDETFHKELNTVMHDAAHRAVTGKFTEPSQEGFVPHGRKVPLHTALQLVRDSGHQMGLTGLHETLKKPLAKTLPKGAKLPKKGSKAIGDQTENRANAAAGPIAEDSLLDQGFQREVKEGHQPISTDGVAPSPSVNGWNACRACGSDFEMAHPADLLCPDCNHENTLSPAELEPEWIVQRPPDEPAIPWSPYGDTSTDTLSEVMYGVEPSEDTREIESKYWKPVARDSTRISRAVHSAEHASPASRIPAAPEMKQAMKSSPKIMEMIRAQQKLAKAEKPKEDPDTKITWKDRVSDAVSTLGGFVDAAPTGTVAAHKNTLRGIRERARISQGLPPHDKCSCETCAQWRKEKVNTETHLVKTLPKGAKLPISPKSKRIGDQTENLANFGANQVAEDSLLDQGFQREALDRAPLDPKAMLPPVPAGVQPYGIPIHGEGGDRMERLVYAADQNPGLGAAFRDNANKITRAAQPDSSSNFEYEPGGFHEKRFWADTQSRARYAKPSPASSIPEAGEMKRAVKSSPKIMEMIRAQQKLGKSELKKALPKGAKLPRPGDPDIGDQTENVENAGNQHAVEDSLLGAGFERENLPPWEHNTAFMTAAAGGPPRWIENKVAAFQDPNHIKGAKNQFWRRKIHTPLTEQQKASTAANIPSKNEMQQAAQDLTRRNGAQPESPIFRATRNMRYGLGQRNVIKSELKKAKPPHPTNLVTADQLQEQGFKPTPGYTTKQGLGTRLNAVRPDDRQGKPVETEGSLPIRGPRYDISGQRYITPETIPNFIDNVAVDGAPLTAQAISDAYHANLHSDIGRYSSAAVSEPADPEHTRWGDKLPNRVNTDKLQEKAYWDEIKRQSVPGITNTPWRDKSIQPGIPTPNREYAKKSPTLAAIRAAALQARKEEAETWGRDMTPDYLKSELNKSLQSPAAAGVTRAPQLHNTVEGFMNGLKALPKGTADRGRFITSHMSHPDFLGALQKHPQGKQIHAMLTNHLNSVQNAGLGAGTKTVAKSEPLEKRSKNVRQQLAAAPMSTVNRRVADYLRPKGVAVDEVRGKARHEPMHYVPGTGQVHVFSDPVIGLPAAHEAGHAFQTPVGQTVDSYQESIGDPGTPKNDDQVREEMAANKIAAGIARRAGARPIAVDRIGAQMLMEHADSNRAMLAGEDYQGNFNMDFGGAADEGVEHGRAILNRMDQGAKFVGGKMMHSLASIHARINARGARQTKKSELAKALPRGAKLAPRGSSDVGDQTENEANALGFLNQVPAQDAAMESGAKLKPQKRQATKLPNIPAGEPMLSEYMHSADQARGYQGLKDPQGGIPDFEAPDTDDYSVENYQAKARKIASQIAAKRPLGDPAGDALRQHGLSVVGPRTPDEVGMEPFEAPTDGPHYVWPEDDEHPDYPRSDWEYEVANGDTRRDYSAWVAAQEEAATHFSGDPASDHLDHLGNPAAPEPFDDINHGNPVQPVRGTASDKAAANSFWGNVGINTLGKSLKQIHQNLHKTWPQPIKPEDKGGTAPSKDPNAEAAHLVFQDRVAEYNGGKQVKPNLAAEGYYAGGKPVKPNSTTASVAQAIHDEGIKSAYDVASRGGTLPLDRVPTVDEAELSTGVTMSTQGRRTLNQDEVYDYLQNALPGDTEDLGGRLGYELDDWKHRRIGNIGLDAYSQGVEAGADEIARWQELSQELGLRPDVVAKSPILKRAKRVKKSEDLTKGDVIKFPGNKAPPTQQSKPASVTSLPQKPLAVPKSWTEAVQETIRSGADRAKPELEKAWPQPIKPEDKGGTISSKDPAAGDFNAVTQDMLLEGHPNISQRPNKRPVPLNAPRTGKDRLRPHSDGAMDAVGDNEIRNDNLGLDRQYEDLDRGEFQNEVDEHALPLKPKGGGMISFAHYFVPEGEIRMLSNPDRLNEFGGGEHTEIGPGRYVRGSDDSLHRFDPTTNRVLKVWGPDHTAHLQRQFKPEIPIVAKKQS